MTFSRFKEILLFAFLTFTVLYYFLRFQWGWDQSIVVLQVILLMAIGGTAVFKAISGRAFHPSFFYIVILYSIALLLPTFIRGE